MVKGFSVLVKAWVMFYKLCEQNFSMIDFEGFTNV